ncbi:uncharacterized protein LOC119467421 [Cebus imitator]|uniref:uncharacterized protein LOC119467421 n=1 Tax=Cebus imitator TaxID=2715852 RepID=UPI0018973148|nr:uncharacterized protein LOC119467421 [Cebus imitator]
MSGHPVYTWRQLPSLSLQSGSRTATPGAFLCHSQPSPSQPAGGGSLHDISLSRRQAAPSSPCFVRPDRARALKGCRTPTPAFPGREPAEPQRGRRGVPRQCFPAPPGSARAERGGTRRACWAPAPPSGRHLGTRAAGAGASTLRSRQPSILRWPRGGGRAAPCSPEASSLTRPPEEGSAGRNRSRFVLHLGKMILSLLTWHFGIAK